MAKGRNKKKVAKKRTTSKRLVGKKKVGLGKARAPKKGGKKKISTQKKERKNNSSVSSSPKAKKKKETTQQKAKAEDIEKIEQEDGQKEIEETEVVYNEMEEPGSSDFESDSSGEEYVPDGGEWKALERLVIGKQEQRKLRLEAKNLADETTDAPVPEEEDDEEEAIKLEDLGVSKRASRKRRREGNQRRSRKKQKSKLPTKQTQKQQVKAAEKKSARFPHSCCMEHSKYEETSMQCVECETWWHHYCCKNRQRWSFCFTHADREALAVGMADFSCPECRPAIASQINQSFRAREWVMTPKTRYPVQLLFPLEHDPTRWLAENAKVCLAISVTDQCTVLSDFRSCYGELEKLARKVEKGVPNTRQMEIICLFVCLIYQQKPEFGMLLCKEVLSSFLDAYTIQTIQCLLTKTYGADLVLMPGFCVDDGEDELASPSKRRNMSDDDEGTPERKKARKEPTTAKKKNTRKKMTKSKGECGQDLFEETTGKQKKELP